MRKRLCFFVALLPTISPWAAASAVVIYERRAEWTASVGENVKTIDFSAYDANRPITVPPRDIFLSHLTISNVTFSSPDRLSFGSFHNDFIYAVGGARLRIQLPENVSAVGMDLTLPLPTLGTYEISVSTGEAFSFPAAGNGTLPTFFGLTTTTPISWIEIRLNRTEPATFNAIDNFAFHIGGLPEGESLSPHQKACATRYRSYDPKTDTFLGYDGQRHRCRQRPR